MSRSVTITDLPVEVDQAFKELTKQTGLGDKRTALMAFSAGVVAAPLMVAELQKVHEAELAKLAKAHEAELKKAAKDAADRVEAAEKQSQALRGVLEKTEDALKAEKAKAAAAAAKKKAAK